MASAASALADLFSNPSREIELLHEMLRVQHCTHRIYYSDKKSDSFDNWCLRLPQLDDAADNLANANDPNNPHLLTDGNGWRWNVPSNFGIKVSLYLLLMKIILLT